MISLFVTAFITGLFGSLHCAGMCGPLALSFNTQNTGNTLFNALVYNLSRVFAYFLLGVIFGTIGLSFSYAGLQQWSSILMGVLIIILIVIQYLSHKNNFPFLTRYTNFIKQKISKAFSSKSFYGIASLGFLNGLLPCGLVYLALAGAVASGEIWSGGIYMMLFGLGTLPLMYSFAAFGNYLGIHKRILIRKYLPLFSILIASLLILRGLNLGIPYLSPHFDIAGEVMDCCKVKE